MIVFLDTNVISELMLGAPDRRVTTWLDSQTPDDVWTTSVNVYEIEAGLAQMPHGQRRRHLFATFEILLDTVLGGRIAAFDLAAARAATELAALRRRVGRPVGLADTLIAGIALARGATIATRNTADFHGLATPVVDPWRDR